MPRSPRCAPEGFAQHVLNRGNDRKRVFRKPGDYLAFMRYMRDTQDRIPLRVLAFQLMPNHFHLVLWPADVAELSAFMNRLMNLHVRSYHAHYGTTGSGHIWQGRYKNFPIQHDVHLLRVMRYVEANALRARLVRRAEDWTWSSLAAHPASGGPHLTPCPVARPHDWTAYVNEIASRMEMARVRRSVRRGSPYGDDDWVSRTTADNGLEATIAAAGGAA
jgi:putative transposase